MQWNCAVRSWQFSSSCTSHASQPGIYHAPLPPPPPPPLPPPPPPPLPLLHYHAVHNQNFTMRIEAGIKMEECSLVEVFHVKLYLSYVECIAGRPGLLMHCLYPSINYLSSPWVNIDMRLVSSIVVRICLNPQEGWEQISKSLCHVTPRSYSTGRLGTNQ